MCQGFGTANVLTPMSRAAKPLRLAVALLASAMACLVPAAPALAVGPTAWPTYHLDGTRSGNDTADGPFTAVSGPVSSGTLDGTLWASPLYLNGTVFAATENDTVYALDGSSLAVLWSLNLGSPATSSNLPCGNVTPTVGITSTPVIDVAGGILYAAGLVFNGSTYAHHLWAVSLSSHSKLRDVVVDAPNSDPKVQNQRGALGLANGRVYVPYGGRDGDCGTYHGFVVSVAAGDLSGLRVDFESTAGSGHSGGGIWAAGGTSSDASANVYAATGNGFGLGSTFDFSETVVKISPAGPGAVDWWAPTNWPSLDSGDTDIGSFTPSVLGSTGYLFQAGKDGVGRLINSNNMGHVSNPSFQAALGFGGCFGSAAFDGTRIYVPCSNGLVAVSYVAGNPPSFSAAWHVSGCFADSPIVAGAAVWFKDRCGNLKVVDPSSGNVRFTLNTGSAEHFATPSAGGGNVYIGLANNTVRAYSMVTSAPVPGNGSSTYTLDGLGGVHPAGTAPALSGAPAFSFDIARALAINQAGTGGVELDGYGGLHPLGGASASSGTYFGWDIARGLALSPSSAGQGWTLDGWGGIHPYGGAMQIVGSYSYWPGWDIARGIVVMPDSSPTNPSGYVLDGYGGLHPFGAAAPITVGPYWSGFDIARGVALKPGATLASPGGWVLDGYGGIHAFGSAAAVAGSYDYWPGWDIARGLTVWDMGTPGVPSGWTLDAYGALHPFGGAPPLSGSNYQGGYDIFRACAAGGFAGGWDSGSKRIG